MHARVHIGRDFADGVIVKLDVGVEKAVDGANVVFVFGPALAELLGAEVWFVLVEDLG